jgi:nitrogen regulatory protein PII-like uncharacterized protein
VEIPYTFNEKVQKIDRQMKEKLAMTSWMVLSPPLTRRNM